MISYNGVINGETAGASSVLSVDRSQSVALVIGGARGIGRSCADALANDGWSVVVADRSLDGFDGPYPAIDVDVSLSDSVNSLFSRVSSEFGVIGAVVNTAGITNQAPTPTVSDQDWDEMLTIHLGGSFKVARAAAQHMSDHGGALVFFSSIAGSMGLPYRASYCASKAGIEGLTRSLAVEFAGVGIRVNAVAPGWIDTGLIEKDLQSGLVSETLLQTRISLRRLGTVAEVGSTVAFLCSPGASYITGQTIAIDGGLSIDLDPGNREAIAQKAVARH